MFAEMLNDTATDIISDWDPMTETEKNDVVAKLQKHSYDTMQLNVDLTAPLQASLDRLDAMLGQLSQNATEIAPTIDRLLSEIDQLNSSLLTTVPDRLVEYATDYGQNVTRHVDVFADWLNVQLRENIGACQPIYGIHTNTLNIVCSYMVDSLNAFWFSLGWATVMLLPSIIFSTKLYKWFRRMDQEEYFDEYMTGYDQQNHYYNDASKPSAPPINYLT
jgi:prominin 1